jgi:hypothetical protein
MIISIVAAAIRLLAVTTRGVASGGMWTHPRAKVNAARQQSSCDKRAESFVASVNASMVLSRIHSRLRDTVDVDRAALRAPVEFGSEKRWMSESKLERRARAFVCMTAGFYAQQRLTWSWRSFR